MLTVGQKVRTHSGYTGRIIETGVIPDTCFHVPSRGRQGVLIQWDLLNEVTGALIPFVPRGDGTQWVTPDGLEPI